MSRMMSMSFVCENVKSLDDVINSVLLTVWIEMRRVQSHCELSKNKEGWNKEWESAYRDV